MRSRTVLLGMVVALALGAVPASVGADERSKERETSGDRGPLEIAGWSFSHAPGNVLVHEFRFVEDFNPSWLEGRDAYAEIGVLFRTSDKRSRVVVLRVNPDGSLFAAVRGKNQIRGFVNAWMPDARTLRIELAQVSLWPRLNAYRWRLLTFYFEDGHEDCGEGDPEIVDDEGCRNSTRWVRHPL